MRWLVVSSLFLGVAAPAQMPPAPPVAESGYILGPGDQIEVAVLGQPEFTTRAKIRADGAIALPYLNAVPAEGLSPVEFGRRITHLLKAGGFYAKPIVSVEIAAYASRYVIVLGEVGAPGIVPIDRPYHLSEIIARSGGLRESGADYVVLRHDGTPERRFRYDQLGTGSDADDPLVNPNDKIFVPPAPTFYIYGQVNAAGNYPIRTSITLRQAIARAGGLKDAGTEKHAKVIRNGARAILHLDDPIAAGDVITIGERLF